jgi:hypothetical protein
MKLVITTYATYAYDKYPYDENNPAIIDPGTHEFVEVGPNCWPCIINGHTGECLDLTDMTHLTEFLHSACGIIWSYDGEIPPEGLVTVSPHWVK